MFASLIDDPAADASDAIASSQRGSLFRLLETILPLDAAKNPSLFCPVRELLHSTSTDTPTVMDPFCGGGSTILEAQRLGLRTIGCDLNPIPVLITTVLTRYPSLFSGVSPVNPELRLQSELTPSTGRALIEDVRYYAGVIAKRAQVELAPFYPELKIPSSGLVQNATVMSWIWSRTTRCPNPACGIVTPLASSFELTRSGNGGTGACWIEPRVVISPLGRKVEYGIGSGPGEPLVTGCAALQTFLRADNKKPSKYLLGMYGTFEKT